MSGPLPYTSLRAFEAVARLESFSEAARELGVSQSAVSQQVRSLEEWLGQPLLVRAQRRSHPTAEGKQLARVVAEGFDGISQACDRLRAVRRAPRAVTLSCLPGFAFIWLFPRLLSFDLAHPNIAISITTGGGGGGLPLGRADVGIRYGRRPEPGPIVEPLVEETVFPVCSPALAEGLHPIETVDDLRHHTLLYDEFSPLTVTPPTWEFWARENGLTLPKPARTRTFGQSNLVVQAAIAGLGVALGRTPLVDEALQDGRLCRPFAQEARSLCRYWLVYEERVLRSERIRVFVDWIKAEAARESGARGVTPIA